MAVYAAPDRPHGPGHRRHRRRAGQARRPRQHPDLLPVGQRRLCRIPQGGHARARAPHRYNMPTVDGRPMHVGNLPHLAPGPAGTPSCPMTCRGANASNTPFRRYKSWVHEGGISTPFIAHWPNGIATPSIVHSPIHITDIMPTCVEVVGRAVPGTVSAIMRSSRWRGRAWVPSFRDDRWQRGKPICVRARRKPRGARRTLGSSSTAIHVGGSSTTSTTTRTELNDLAEPEKRRVETMAQYWRGERPSASGNAPNQALVDRIADRHPENWTVVRKRFRVA